VARRVRYTMRDAFRETKLLDRIIPDIADLLSDEVDEDELGNQEAKESHMKDKEKQKKTDSMNN
ncbi:MAG: hypothetical protein R6U19_03250, partial [Bacteroidales bacterium]